MSWKAIDVSSWPHFQSLVSGYGELESPLVTPYLFRGQPQADWPLVPSLLRHLGVDVGVDEALEVENMLLEQFQSQSHLYWDREPPTNSSDRWEWWALMQHHGVPTRLLDWTASPYVAAYFAVESSWGHDGAVFVMHPATLNNYSSDDARADEETFARALKDPSASSWIRAFSAARLSARMAAQQGHFTLCANVCANQSDLIHAACTAPPFDDDENPNAVKLCIPAKLKPSFLIQLRTMNVTGRSLFPGADGFGRSLLEATRLHAFKSREEAELYAEIEQVARNLADN